MSQFTDSAWMQMSHEPLVPHIQNSWHTYAEFAIWVCDSCAELRTCVYMRNLWLFYTYVRGSQLICIYAVFVTEQHPAAPIPSLCWFSIFFSCCRLIHLSLPLSISDTYTFPVTLPLSLFLSLCFALSLSLCVSLAYTLSFLPSNTNRVSLSLLLPFPFFLLCHVKLSNFQEHPCANAHTQCQ